MRIRLEQTWLNNKQHNLTTAGYNNKTRQETNANTVCESGM